MDSDETSEDDLDQLRRQVARYPTDLQTRFRLGAALCTRKEYDSAVPELQKAMKSPHTKLRAMRLLIEAFEAKGMPSLAAGLREHLSREPGGDDESGLAGTPAPARPKPPIHPSGRKKPP